MNHLEHIKHYLKKKAFDLVDHDVLVHKLDLHHFSTSALHLMKSYIYDRSQLVKI